MFSRWIGGSVGRGCAILMEGGGILHGGEEAVSLSQGGVFMEQGAGYREIFCNSMLL